MFDLHVHTMASDGEYSPEEVVKIASKNNLTTISITDHDTVSGLDRAIKEGKSLNIDVIPGVELNAYVEKGKMHILGYCMNYKDVDFANTMDELKKDREERNKKFIQELNNQNININLDEVKKYSYGEILAKPHFAQALLEKHYIDNIEEAYTKYFNVYPMNNIKRKKLLPKEVIEIIKKAGGIAVLAHPVTLKLDDNELEKKIKELTSYGLDGIECYNKIHTKEDIEKLNKIANKLNMLITAGSDFHGPISTPNVGLGTWKNNQICDESNILNCFKEYIKNNR